MEAENYRVYVRQVRCGHAVLRTERILACLSVSGRAYGNGALSSARMAGPRIYDVPYVFEKLREKTAGKRAVSAVLESREGILQAPVDADPGLPDFRISEVPGVPLRFASAPPPGQAYGGLPSVREPL